MTSTVEDARPPLALIRVMNPVMRWALRTPVGRLIRPFALLELTGRRSGRHLRVPVGWYLVDGVPAVFSPAPWRANLAGGAPVTVHHLGKPQPMVATLERDPAAVAEALQWLIDHGTPAARVGLRMDPGHRITADDVVHVDRALIRFAPADPPAGA